jgi:hypothetical protein
MPYQDMSTHDGGISDSVCTLAFGATLLSDVNEEALLHRLSYDE